jgi:MoaA/NifB/PqqE/SkfB family radical SAM enzyme
MLAIVGQMPGAGLPRLILTGGEPFLYPGDVIALIRAARAARVQRISINSNGYWASSDERARQMLERLAEAGFMLEPEDNLKISSGIYHIEFVDLDRIFTLARCYHERFGRPVIVDFELEAGAPHTRDAAIERFRAAGLLDRVDLQFRTISPLGRARQFEDLPASDCAVPCGIIDQIVFDPDGLVRPCCGLNNENFGVAVGRLGEHGLRDLVKRAQNDPVLQFLSRKPMNAIFEELGRSPRAQGYAGICDLCQHAIGDLRDKEPLQARLFAGQRFYPFWFTPPR